MILPNKTLIFGYSIVVLSMGILIYLTIHSSSDQITFKSILIGDLLAILNFILGLLFVHWGINSSNKKFLISLFGGLLLRLTIMLVLVIISLKFLEINEISFIFSILFFYIFYIIIEIIYLNLRKR